ncbi:aminotransferase class I/II-fold pyridoxal phosphate-dependent enzyme [Aequorivita sp. F47161]|uniref:Aminotransferase class I/II-fold pyridoxal phosphate-dependent enzyme n=1 Tax=Aequorivita vitellina TaxID=2874475 RepID=A0A9X1QWS3_9FLAO|nr:methionine aminotransferase [Aequorivita vitellina]MCG2418034.1 aminotransferase class I/II-fold pyridoxal phosphate-dependent enzyme [Aequorivita vitellina]MCZ4317578.1 methionine aminotransferase [Aequorivita viscosa]
MIIPSKLPNISTSIFSVMGQMAAEYEAINLSQGFPNFPSDPALNALVDQAMRDGFNQYAPMQGDFELRMEISKKIENLYQHFYNPETEITITAGATQAIFTIIAATISKGDEVIIFTPAYDCYAPTVQLFGGKIVPIQLKPPSYGVDWKEVSDKISSKTKMIIINSPHNPSGMLFSEEDMLELQRLAEKNDLLVLSDEVYEHIIFDGNVHQSASKFDALANRSFITASFGKTFHNTGWKMGYCAAPEYLMKEFQKVHQFVVFCVNHPIQKALATYLKDANHYLKLSDFYQQKRDFFLHLMEGSNFKIIPSKGTYFQMLDFSEISTENDIAFAERLTKELKIATIPTSVFNEGKKDFKQIRVCFAKTDETLAEAAKILSEL